MLSSMQVNSAKMPQFTENDFSNATELKQIIWLKRSSFREAQEIVGKLVFRLYHMVKIFKIGIWRSCKSTTSLIEEDIYIYLRPETAVQSRNS